MPRRRHGLNRPLQLGQRLLLAALGLIQPSQAKVASGVYRGHCDGLLIGMLRSLPIRLPPVPVAQGRMGLPRRRSSLNCCLELGQRLRLLTLSLICLT